MNLFQTSLHCLLSNDIKFSLPGTNCKKNILNILIGVDKLQQKLRRCPLTEPIKLKMYKLVANLVTESVKSC